MQKKTFLIILYSFAALAFATVVKAQPVWTIDPFGKEKKPEKYENRKLGSEKTADKKFTKFRRGVQNTVTHYNYYYNANNKLNAVLERARLANKDDYSRLLSFYPYSLEQTSTQKQELDSTIYKCTSGILLHDLRNDWIDNLYLLIGKSYYFRKDFDSAVMTFQFINYNLFPRKKGEDDNRVVGGNDNASGNNISIANKEKQNLIQRIKLLPPSRNDALIWLARTLTEQNEFAESAGLINTLQNDANLPTRLRNDLDEVAAYWFYKQSIYDSAAVHLEKSLSNAADKPDKARREFLLAQLLEMTGDPDRASEFYSKASKHTVDPLMDIYAQLNDAKMYRSGGNEKEIKNSIAALVKMARKDKFEPYRDIVYYSAGVLAMQLPDTASAIGFFNKSIEKNESNVSYRNKAYVALGDIAYERKAYKLAAAMYDSLQMTDTTFATDLGKLQARRGALTKIVDFITIIEREDSLQYVAAMAPADREAFIKKIVKKIRKENGLKEDPNATNNPANPFDNKGSGAADLFAGNNSKGEWYFYNASLKSRGFNEFKTKWGNRINADNWRRKGAIDAGGRGPAGVADVTGNAATNGAVAAADVSYESLLEQLPLTTNEIDSSNTLIASAMLNLAKVYQNDLEDYEEAVKTYEAYLTRFPNKLDDGNVYLGLYYCYNKLGDKAKADYYKSLLNTKFSGTKAWQMLNTPQVLNPKNSEATKIYEGIYNLFLEGKFEQALEEKKKADAQFGVNYWTPQLIYIEALYHVKQRNDSLAIAGLSGIIQNHPTSPLKEKAATMIDVLQRRKEIEGYLTSLQVTREVEEKVIMQDDNASKPVAKATSTAPVVPPAVLPVVKPKVIVKDTVKTIPTLTKNQFVMNTALPHVVLMILDKVDGVYINEARNAFNRYNRENYYGQTIEIVKDALDAEKQLLVIGAFADGAAALDYYEKIKRSAPREVSWLPAAKYSFIMITPENLQVLKTNRDMAGYKTLLNTLYPGKF